MIKALADRDQFTGNPENAGNGWSVSCLPTNRASCVDVDAQIQVASGLSF
jgi:hypothetical protein